MQGLTEPSGNGRLRPVQAAAGPSGTLAAARGLAVLGVSVDAEAVYAVALTGGSWATEDLVAAAAQVGGRAPAAVRTGVAELVALGLLRTASTQSEGELRVVAPDVVLQDRLADSRSQLRQQELELERASRHVRALQEYYARCRDAQVEHTVERLTGLDAVRGRLEQLARDTSQEIQSFLRGPLTPEAIEASWPLDREALQRGVNLRQICLHSALNDSHTTAYLRRLDEAGGETRTAATLPLQMVIVDRRTAVIPIDPDRSAAGALLVRSRGALVALLALFESVWLNARALGEPRRAETADLSDTDRDILAILAKGATDEVVARQLGVSVRTVRRLTSVLMERFQAQSRFELGLRLGQQGVVQPVARRSRP